MDIVSTREVAALLGVSEATVKRWADGGMLRCFRTPGGHRKFRLRDVKAFLADQRDEGAPIAPGPARELTPEQASARSLALAGDVDGLVSLVAGERLRGTSLATTFDTVVSPALHDIGDGWAQGRLSVAQEHVAAGTVTDAIARLRPLIERSARVDRGRAICACVPGELHDVAIRMVSLVLLAEGYRSVLVGANVPAGDLALLVAGSPTAIVALSASSTAKPELVRGDLAVLASAAQTARAELVVGGPGFDAIGALPGRVRRYKDLRELVAATQSAREEGETPRADGIVTAATDETSAPV